MTLKRSVRRTLTRTMVVAVCVLGIAGAVPAADALPQRIMPEPDMVLRPANTDVFTLTVRGKGKPDRGAHLTCAPTGGNHPSPRKACEQLDAAGGEVAEIPADDGMCTAEYQPVTVIARGVWRGQQRTYQQEFPNHCTAVRDTGGVLFNF